MFYEISYGFRRDACRVLRRVVMRRMVFELASKLWPVIVFFSLVISVPVTLLLRQSERIDLLEERIEVLEAERRSSDTPAE